MNNIKRALWLWVINWIENEYSGSLKPNASLIVDGCIYLREGLRNG